MPGQFSALELEKLLDLQTEFASAKPDFASLIQLISDRTRELTGSAGVVLELLEADDLVYRATSGSSTSQLGLRIPRKGSFSGLSIETKETLICSDSETDPRVNLMACRRVGLRSMIVQPLFFDGDVIGVLKILSPNIDAFDAHIASYLKLFSGTMAATLYNAFRWAEKEMQIDSLSYHASHDSMTGLFNRSAFFDNLRICIAKAERSQLKIAVGMSDLDGLKYVNDTYGHSAGDYFITKFAERLNKEAGNESVVARLGGDEFAILLKTQTHDNSLNEKIFEIVNRVEGDIPFEKTKLSLRASAGVAIYPDDAVEAENLMEIADTRLYKNKRERKARTK